jgi:tRNA threonylcarbamoyladenosine biosynthesis protein TsaB
MSLILAVETATEVCSVALNLDGNIVAVKETAGVNEHSAQLTSFIEEVMKLAGLPLSAVDAFAVSMGPGSYTGLRIGVSTAKGLCYALEKPLIAISTLKALSYQALTHFPELKSENIILTPLIDARRMEVYMAMYDSSLKELLSEEARILDVQGIEEFAEYKIAIFGSGAAKCRDHFSGNERILFPGEVQASATAISMLALEKFEQGLFENTAYFEPFYLKDFIAGKPKVKGLYN